MKKTLVTMMLTALSLSAAAQSTEPGETVNVPGHNLRIEVPDQVRYMDRSEFSRYIAAYTLSNGQTMYLTHRGLFGMYARIDREPEHRIVVTGRNAFVALDRQIKLRIDFDNDEVVGGEVVMAVPPASLADNGGTGPQVVTLVAR